jgi:hypothetical protein
MKIKAVIWGLVGSTGLLLFYFFTLFILSGDFYYPWRKFLLFQPWMGLMIVGFGIQTGLYSFAKSKRHMGMLLGADAGVSGVSMAACCAHHLVDILPFFGATGLAIFLGEYQKQLLVLGVLMNFIGIGVMIRMINKIKKI